MPLSIFTLLGCPPGQGRQGCGAELVLPSVENVAILKRKKGGKCANTHRPVWGTSPGFVQSKFFAPVREPPPTGATALEVQQVNHHSRYDVSQRKRCDVPQEVPHGDTLLPEGCPTKRTLTKPRRAGKGGLHGFHSFSLQVTTTILMFHSGCSEINFWSLSSSNVPLYRHSA